MENTKEWYVRTEDGNVYGPADIPSLVRWAEEGRIEPSGFVSKDRISWQPAQLMNELGMEWLVEMEPGKVFGPYNRKFLISLYESGSVHESAKAYRLYGLPVAQDPQPVVVEKEVIKEVRVEVPVEVEKIVEKEVIKEVRVEVPVEVEKIVEKEVVKEVRVEVPVEVEKIVEKEVIKEVRVEVPVEVEKIVEVEKVVEVERIVEVEPPARTTLVVPEVAAAIDAPPPQRSPSGIFGNVDRRSLEALESAARRELAAVRGGGKFNLFGRKK